MKQAHIDSIRGVAILMVILVHVSLITKGVHWIIFFLSRYGQMGVQLFFVASAFTLCLSSDTRRNESMPHVKFAIRRFFRIAPAYYLGIVFYSFFQWISPYKEPGTYPTGIADNIISVVLNVFFLHGFVPSANNHVVPGGWSIGNEMLFYAIFPTLSLKLNKKSTSFGRSFAWIGFLLAIAYSWSFAVEKICGVGVRNHNFFYYNIVNQLPVFIIGMCYYSLWKNGKMNICGSLNLMFFSIFTFMALLLFKYEFIPSAFILIPTISGISFVFLIESFRKIPLLNNTILQRMGTTSYSMYLAHFFFVIVTEKFFIEEIKAKLGPNLTLFVVYIIIISLTFMCALFLEKWLEKPSINLGKKFIKHLSDNPHKTTTYH